MKNVVFKTKFDDCKNLREILDKIDNSFFEKVSYKLLSMWILYPLLMMIITYKFNNDLARNIMFYLLIFIGISGILLGVIYSLKKFYKKEKINIKKYLTIILGIILLIWCLFTSFFADNYNLTFTGELYRKEGLQTYFLYGGILLLGALLKNKKLLVKLFKNLLFVEIIIGIITLFNNSITYSLMHNHEPYTGIFSQFNHYGYYLMFGIILSIFMFLNSKNKLFKIMYLTIYVFLLHLLILNDTFGCFLAILLTLILIILYFIFIKKEFKKIISIIILFILVSLITFKNDENIVYKNFKNFFSDAKIVNDVVKKKNDKNSLNSIGTSRGKLWKYGIKYISKSPIIGHGIESTYILYFNDQINQSRPHNILIHFGIFTGIPGIILYVSFILSILFRNLRKLKKLDYINIFSLFIVICYFISSMFGNSMFYTSPYFFIFLGIVCKNAFYKKELT